MSTNLPIGLTQEQATRIAGEIRDGVGTLINAWATISTPREIIEREVSHILYREACRLSPQKLPATTAPPLCGEPITKQPNGDLYCDAGHWFPSMPPDERCCANKGSKS